MLGAALVLVTEERQISARISLEFPSARLAEIVANAVALENLSYIEMKREGQRVTAEASAPSPMSLLHTLEDFLTCVSVAEKAASTKKGPD